MAKFLLYVGAFLLIGGASSRAWLTPQHPRLRWLGLGLLLLALGASLNVFYTLQALDALSPTDIFNYLTRIEAGRSTLLMLLGSCVLLAVELSGLSWLALLGAAGITLWGMAGIGHGASHGDWVRVLHTLHAGAMCVWLNGVLALWTFKSAGPADARRFTPVALLCVFTLVLSGIIITLNHAGNLLQLPQTEYGRALLLKLAIFALGLLASVLVRRSFAAGKNIRAHLLAELVLLTAVLGVTSQLTQLEPPTHSQHSAPGHKQH